MAKPTFLITGVMKSGTTSLHQYLDGHPDVFVPAEKEVNHFNTSVWKTGLAKYEEKFDPTFSIRGEASPGYMTHVMPRIIPTYPDVKLIVILRNPVDRMVSHMRHLYRLEKVVPRSFPKGVENLRARLRYNSMSAMPEQRAIVPFETILESPRPDIEHVTVAVSLYKFFLEPLHQAGVRPLVLSFDDLRFDQEKVFKSLCEYIGADYHPAERHIHALKKIEGSESITISEEVAQRYDAYFADTIQWVSDTYGIDLTRRRDVP